MKQERPNRSLHTLSDSGFSIAITGSGGSGTITTGLILLESIAKAGLYGLMSRSVGPQIRGGESVAMLRLSTDPVDCLDDCFDLLVGLDWCNTLRFAEEIPLHAHSLIVTDEAAGTIPESLLASNPEVLQLAFKQLISDIEGGRSNMLALGIIGRLAGLPLGVLKDTASVKLSGKGDQVTAAAVSCIEKGYSSISQGGRRLTLPGQHEKQQRWNISGNEASGLGALRGGVRFVAAYPITPASDMLEWLSPRLEQLGGSLLQAEDELASINMAIGASFGGVPAMTATSGPGLSLMAESLGLAVASETPVVAVNVTRGGPSTGLPTKSEQSDLNLALYGMHGDAPHLVLAPISIADCARTTEWAVGLAEQLQTVAIVLMDQALGQTRVITDPAESAVLGLGRDTHKPLERPYLRYQLCSDGVSPMVRPGTVGCMYTGEGLEHNEKGLPSSLALDHEAQLEKRRKKLTAFDYGRQWMACEGEGEICLITWGSTATSVFEAARRVRVLGIPVKVVAVRLLAPLQQDVLQDLMENAIRILVVEQNQQAQFFHYLHAHQVLPAHAESFARPGPSLFRPGEIVERILPVSQA